jgi:hypothetical protein
MTTTLPGGPVIETATLQCCHCGGHFPVQPGSGKIRGFCRRCMAPVCGPGCAACVPTEQLLENIEHGRPLDHRPTKISMSE